MLPIVFYVIMLLLDILTRILLIHYIDILTMQTIW